MRASDYDFEALAQGLVGETLTGVCYFETPLFGDCDDGWTRRHTGAHVTAHGVDLDLVDRTVAVTLGNQYSPYNLELLPMSLSRFLLAGRFEQVPEIEPWATVIGKKVTSSRVLWAPRDASVANQRYPLALALIFEDRHSVLLAAASLAPDQKQAFAGGDDIVIAWTHEQVAAALPELADAFG